MKNRLFYTFGLIVLLMVAFITSLCEAASGNGPYYSSSSWDQKIACTKASNCPRFEVLTNWGGAAVLDKETGLVWERSPNISTFPNTWYAARTYCNQLATGGRLGWRLPTLQELTSLLDPTLSHPWLPTGHPFNNVMASYYWSASTVEFPASTSYPPYAWVVNLGATNTTDLVDTCDKSICNFNCWCVRGGQGVDPQ